ncbi:hypothetical protein HG537_0F03640 [Torulaspora globosa]|uniref:phosphoinositide 5-phosphatase n=1 Tax=Torulaspora globosa TaxID=48254 RepID=A0A7H9HWB7_9SACH|nr:hypothetical protein HG537_0F03640 [Torulaspora sp. CBS 2947]
MKLFIGRNPRSAVVSSNGYNLCFQRLPTVSGNSQAGQPNSKAPVVALRSISDEELGDDKRYFELKNRMFSGLVGLVSLNGNLYLAVVSGAQKVGFPRWTLENGNINSSGNVFKVLDVEFHALDGEIYDHLYLEPTEQNYEKLIHEHPCGSLKKLLSDGSFYFSRDFDISNVLKSGGPAHNLDYTIDNQDMNNIWNASFISEIINWRSRIPAPEKDLVGGEFFTFLMRGFYKTVIVEQANAISTITLVSRISAESKQNSFTLEGVDEYGKVSNFVETEIIVSTEDFFLSYTQVSGNVPLFWEVVEGQLLYGRKLKLTKGIEHTQAAFDRHFDNLASKYGVVSVLNLVKPKSESQELMADAYKHCAEMKGIKFTSVEYGSRLLTKTPHKLLYLLKQDLYEFGAFAYDIKKKIYVGKQTGVLRISCFDSVRRINTVEKLVSREVLELTSSELSGIEISSLFLKAHDRLWSESNYWLEAVYSKNSKNPSKYRKVYGKLFNSKVKIYDPLHSTISQYLRQRKESYTYKKEITIFAGTFNVSGKIASDDVTDWICPDTSNRDSGAPEMYVIGLEEVVELTPGHILSTDPYVKSYWEKKILAAINGLNPERRYGCVWSTQLGGILLMLFVSELEYPKVKHIEGDMKKTGFGGMTSNKGAVAVSFKYSATKFCLLVSHLAAGLDNVEQRHNDYKTIVKNIRFSRGLKIKDHDVVIWMGDFNYRILMSNDEVRKMIAAEEFSKLFERDQLNQQMIAGEAFPYYHEMEIKFPPTYKFDPGTKTYDTSDKMRIPAWTDRILSRGTALRQLTYGCAENILFSDHRPVYATFRAIVTVLDEQEKAALAAEIYQKIARKLASLNEKEKLALLNDGSLLVESLQKDGSKTAAISPLIASGHTAGVRLPPPSSDLKKWWIGNGKQVKVVIDVDPSKCVLNPQRSVNPFSYEDKEEPLFIPREIT